MSESGEIVSSSASIKDFNTIYLIRFRGGRVVFARGAAAVKRHTVHLRRRALDVLCGVAHQFHPLYQKTLLPDDGRLK